MVRLYLVFGRTIAGDYENIWFALSRAEASLYALRLVDREKRARRRRFDRVFVHEIDVQDSGFVSRPIDWLDVVPVRERSERSTLV